MAAKGKPKQTTGDGRLSNVQALEVSISMLPAPLTDLQLAVGRRLAELVDGPEPSAATIGQYRAWIEQVESAIPATLDEIDLAQ